MQQLTAWPEPHTPRIPPQGEIPKINDMPAPWGPKPYTPTAEESFIPKYPQSFNPLVDTTA